MSEPPGPYVAVRAAHFTPCAGDTCAASSRMLSSAQAPSKESDRLKIEADKFLQTVRAA